MIRLLDKKSGLGVLTQLFDLLYENMQTVAPSGLEYEAEKAQWLDCITSALEKEPRQIALLYCHGELAGFCMYYTNGKVFMIEELQLGREHRGSTLISELWKFFCLRLPEDVAWIEAYADRRNLYSQRLMEKLGMTTIGQGGDYLHYRGDWNRIRNRQ